MAVITSGHPTTLPSLVEFGSAVAPRRGGEIYRSGDFFYFLLFSDARPDQTRRPIWARSTSKDAVSRKDESFRGKKYTKCKFRGVLPQKPPKFSPEIGFPMLNSKSNYLRTVRDRKVIPSANPTKSRTANPKKLVSLTLD